MNGSSNSIPVRVANIVEFELMNFSHDRNFSAKPDPTDAEIGFWQSDVCGHCCVGSMPLGQDSLAGLSIPAIAQMEYGAVSTKTQSEMVNFLDLNKIRGIFTIG